MRMLQTETLRPSTGLHPLHAAIVRVLAYYDLFAYPLRSDEIFTYLPTSDATEAEVLRMCDKLVAGDLLGYDCGFYFLPHRSISIVNRRIQMEEQGKKMWNTARVIACWMSAIPFVRGVFISGQLCRYIADDASDIDYFIVTEPGRLWIVRAILATLRRTLFMNSRKYLCTNYYITTSNLAIAERSTYIACEVASIKPMVNRELYDRFIEANGWVNDYYPNFARERIDYRDGAKSRRGLQRALERLIPAGAANRLDLWLMNFTQQFRQRKYPNRRPETYDVSLRARRDESRTFPNDQAPLIQRRYQDGLRRYGLTHD